MNEAIIQFNHLKNEQLEKKKKQEKRRRVVIKSEIHEINKTDIAKCWFFEKVKNDQENEKMQTQYKI